VDVRSWLRGFYFTASGDAAPPAEGEGSLASVRRGGRMSDRFQHPETMPSWLTDHDLDVYTAEFERTGFTGGLNRYRNVDRDWEDLSVFRGRPIEVPALFVGGDRDGPTVWGKASIDAFPTNLPALHRSTILSGCGHWTQQERAAEVNRELLEFLAVVRPR
jgi:pimeloyl-ACP methyl ester carboxylesterase